MIRVVIRLKSSKDHKTDIFKSVPAYETEEEVLENRLKLRYYIRDILRNQVILKDITSFK